MTRYAIGLGSNLGDRRQYLVEACRELADRADAWRVSALYETEPVGGPNQGAFLNAVMLVETGLAPVEVLALCREIEAVHGRERAVRWGPRTLDLDILATNGGPVNEDRLVIPHPRAGERAFVLRPLNDVWPEAPLEGGVTAARALDLVDETGVDLVARDWFP